RQARLERRRGRQSDGAEHRARDPHRMRLVLADLRRETPSQLAQQLGLRLEAVLVQVVAGTTAAAQDEVAPEVCVLAERVPELAGVHAKTDRAIASSGSA